MMAAWESGARRSKRPRISGPPERSNGVRASSSMTALECVGRFGLVREVGQRDRDLEPRRDAHFLTGHPEGGAQGVVAGDRAIDGAFEGALIEPALKPEGDGFVERAGGVIAALGGKPDFQLAFAQRDAGRFLRCSIARCRSPPPRRDRAKRSRVRSSRSSCPRRPRRWPRCRHPNGPWSGSRESRPGCECRAAGDGETAAGRAGVRGTGRNRGSSNSSRPWSSGRASGRAGPAGRRAWICEPRSARAEGDRPPLDA